MPLNANALITLAQAKDHLDIPTLTTTFDARIEQFINVVSDHIEYHTGRVLKTATHTHDFDGSGKSELLLREYPVTSITSVNIDRTRTFAGGTLVTDPVKFKDVGIKRARKGVFPDDMPQNVRVVYVAGFATIPFDIQHAALMMLEDLYTIRGQRKTGVEARGKLGDTVSFSLEMPPHIAAMLAPHVREAYVKRKLETP